MPLTVIVSVDKIIRSLSSTTPIIPPSIVTVLSITTTAFSAGVIFMPPFVVCKTMEVSPIIISSAAIAVGIPHSPEPSPSDIHD